MNPTMTSVCRSWMGSSVRLRRATPTAASTAASGTVQMNPFKPPRRVDVTRVDRVSQNAVTVSAARRTHRAATCDRVPIHAGRARRAARVGAESGATAVGLVTLAFGAAAAGAQQQSRTEGDHGGGGRTVEEQRSARAFVPDGLGQRRDRNRQRRKACHLDDGGRVE